MLFTAPGRRAASAAFCALLLSAVSATSAQAQSMAVLPGQTISEDMVNQAFGLISSELVTLNVPTNYDGVLNVTVPFAGGQYALDLSPHSVRGENYNLVVMDETGVARSVAPGPILTKRGVVVGLPDSIVAASVAEGLEANIYLPNGSSIYVVPVSQQIAGAPQSLHAVYHIDDVLALPEDACGLDDLYGGNPPASPEDAPGAPKVDCTGNFWVCQVAIDTDWEYFTALGSVAAEEARINQVINTVNVQYERDVAITHEIVYLETHTTNNDAYTTNDPSNLLGQFQNFWVNNRGGVARDIAHMFTGRNLSGSVIGIAYLRVICSLNSGYGVVQNLTGGSCRADLSAHELGHNWNAQHCTCSGWTMNPSLTCANRFIAGTINVITNYRNGRACLSCSTPTVCQTDIGFRGPGDTVLTICGGDLSSGTTADLEVTNGYNFGSAFLQISLNNNPTPFKGGLLVPVPGVTVGPFSMNLSGAFSLPGIQGGGTATWFLQVMHTDFDVPAPNVGLSNAIRMQMLP